MAVTKWDGLPRPNEPGQAPLRLIRSASPPPTKRGQLGRWLSPMVLIEVGGGLGLIIALVYALARMFGADSGDATLFERIYRTIVPVRIQ